MSDTILPVVNTSLNKSLTNILENDIINISANITDNLGLSFCQFIYNQTGIVNITNVSISGTSAQCSNATLITVAAGNVINFTIRANDTSNNFRTNDTIITVADVTTPVVNTTFNITSPVINDVINFSGNITDNIGLISENITYNISGVLTKINFTLTGTTASIHNITEITTDGGSVINFTMYATDTSNNVKQNSTLITVADRTFPIINLSSPANISGDKDGNITFIYNVTENNLANCSLIINSKLNQTNSSVNGTRQNFTLSNLPVLRYNWSINCTDTANNIGKSEERKVAVILSEGFNGTTTDITAVDTRNISNYIIELLPYGKINFTRPVNLSKGVNLNKHSNISFNRIRLNGTAIPELNVTAIIYLYDLTFTSPRILRDDAVCTDICTKLAYSGGNLTFNVTQFSVYSAEETPTTTATEEAKAETKEKDTAGSGREVIEEIIYTHFFRLIESDKTITIPINKKSLAITQITFEVNKNLEDVDFYVSTLQKPVFTISNAYQYVEIKADNLRKEDIVFSAVYFRVRKDSGFIKDTVSLNKYDGKWIKLPTRFVEEDSNYYYYEGETPGFSLFAITGEKAAMPQGPQKSGAGKITEFEEAEEEIPIAIAQKPLTQELFIVLLVVLMMLDILLLKIKKVIK